MGHGERKRRSPRNAQTLPLSGTRGNSRRLTAATREHGANEVSDPETLYAVGTVRSMKPVAHCCSANGRTPIPRIRANRYYSYFYFIFFYSPAQTRHFREKSIGNYFHSVVKRLREVTALKYYLKNDNFQFTLAIVMHEWRSVMIETYIHIARA